MKFSYKNGEKILTINSISRRGKCQAMPIQLALRNASALAFNLLAAV